MNFKNLHPIFFFINHKQQTTNNKKTTTEKKMFSNNNNNSIRIPLDILNIKKEYTLKDYSFEVVKRNAEEAAQKAGKSNKEAIEIAEKAMTEAIQKEIDRLEQERKKTDSIKEGFAVFVTAQINGQTVKIPYFETAWSTEQKAKDRADFLNTSIHSGSKEIIKYVHEKINSNNDSFNDEDLPAFDNPQLAAGKKGMLKERHKLITDVVTKLLATQRKQNLKSEREGRILQLKNKLIQKK